MMEKKGNLDVLREIKRNGFADSYIARRWEMAEREVYDLRKANGDHSCL